MGYGVTPGAGETGALSFEQRMEALLVRSAEHCQMTRVGREPPVCSRVRNVAKRTLRSGERFGSSRPNPVIRRPTRRFPGTGLSAPAGADGCAPIVVALDERYRFSEAVIHGRIVKWLGWVDLRRSAHGPRCGDCGHSRGLLRTLQWTARCWPIVRILDRRLSGPGVQMTDRIEDINARIIGCLGWLGT